MRVQGTKIIVWFGYISAAAFLLQGQQATSRLYNFSESLLTAVAKPLSVTNDAWLGGVGNWSNAALWTTGVPGGSSNALIDNGNPTASVVNLDVNGSANNVIISSNDALHINDGQSLTVSGSQISNAGNISLNSSGHTTQLIINSANVTLSGGGTVNMSNNPNNYITGGSSTASTLTNQETIQGGGQIGGGTLTLVNSGTINANQSNALTITAGGGTTNTGTLEATNAGTLGFNGTTVTNTNGTINTSGGRFSEINSSVNGGTVNLAGGYMQGASISGAKVAVTGSGNLQMLNSSLINGTLNNSAQIEVAGYGNYSSAIGGTVTNASSGLIQIDDASGLTLQSGTYNNAGTISLNSSGHTSQLQIAASNVTLAGGGTVNLSNNPNNIIFGAAAADTLTNQGTIQGSGNIGNGNMGLINSGNIRANQSVPLIISTSGAGFSNSGSVLVSGGSTLQITSGTPFSNFSGNTLTGGSYNVSGTLQFGPSGANLVTNAANITLNGAASQIIDAGGNNVLKNFAINAPGSTFVLSGARSFNTAGNFSNNGSLVIASGSNFAVAGNLTNLSGTTLTGGLYNVGGTLQVGNSNANIVTNSGNIALTGSVSKIVDSGQNDALRNFANNSIGAAFALNGSRNFTTAGNFANNGTLAVAAGSTFAVNGNLSNFVGTTLTGGTYNVGGVVKFNGANIVTNAANIMLNGPAARFTNQTGTFNALSNFASNATNGAFALAGNQNLTTAGNFTNAGILTVAKGSTFGIGNAGSYTQTNGITTVDGVLASTVNTAALNLNKGFIYGTGSLGFSVVNTGALTPADSASKVGSLVVAGAYKQNSGGALNIAIGGTAAGTGYDQLKVAGTASVAGTLNLSLLNGYVPALGSSFQILTGSSVSGQFSSVNGGSINTNEHFAVTCDSTYCLATVVSGASSISRGHSGLQTMARIGNGEFDSRPLRGAGFSGTSGAVRISASKAEQVGGQDQATNFSTRQASTPPIVAQLKTLQQVKSPAVSRALAALQNPLNQQGRGRRGFAFGVDLQALLSTNPRTLLKSFTGAAKAPSIGYVATTIN